jgi:tetratricopeptide (TPR) repeat protein
MDNETNKYLAEEYNREAGDLYSKRDYAYAVKLLVKVLSFDPLNEAAISGLAFYCLRPTKKELESANITPQIIKLTADTMHRMITKYRQTRSLYYRIYNTCAMLYRRSGDRRMSFYYYSQAWRAAPDNPNYPTQMADILLAEKNYGEAVMLCHHALEIDPTFALAYYIKGQIEIKCKHFAWALDAFESFVALAPQDDPMAIDIRQMLAEINEVESNAPNAPKATGYTAGIQTELFK